MQAWIYIAAGALEMNELLFKCFRISSWNLILDSLHGFQSKLSRFLFPLFFVLNLRNLNIITATCKVSKLSRHVSGLRWVVQGYSRVLGLRYVRGLDKAGQTRSGGVFKDECLHEVIAIVSVDEVIENGVETAVKQRQTLCEMQGNVDHILQAAGQRHQAKLRQGISQENSMVGPPAAQEHHNVGQDYPTAHETLLLHGGGWRRWGASEGSSEQDVKHCNDGEGEDKAQEDEAQLHTHHPLPGVFLWVHRPAQHRVAMSRLYCLQEVRVWQGSEQSQKPHPHTHAATD